MLYRYDDGDGDGDGDGDWDGDVRSVLELDKRYYKRTQRQNVGIAVRVLREVPSHTHTHNTTADDTLHTL